MNATTRSPNGTNVYRFLESYGVRVRPYREGRNGPDRPANVIYGGRTIARLLRINSDRAALTVRCIQESNPKCFDDVMIWAVWSFIGAHADHDQPRDVVADFSRIDLAQIRNRAQRLARGEYGRMGKTAEKISSLIAHALIPEDDAA